MVSRISLSRILPFATYILFMVLADVLMKLGWGPLELRWLYAVRISAVAAVLWIFQHDYAELAFPFNLNMRELGTSIVAGAVVFVIWVNLNADWMMIGATEGFNPQGQGGINWNLIFTRMLGASLIVPVMEELFWRSFLMRWIVSRDFVAVEPARVGVSAFVITAVFFAFEHNLWLAGLVAGAVYNWLYIRSENIWSPIVSHAVTNGLLGIWVISTGNWGYW